MQYRPPRARLITVARRLAVDAHRARRARPPEVLLEEHLARAGGQRADGCIDEFGVRAAIATLPGPQRQVLAEIYCRDRSVAGTARILQIPPGTVRLRTFYGLRSVRRALQLAMRSPSPVRSLPLRRRLAGYAAALGVAALAAAALEQRRLAAAAQTARPIAEADRMRTALLAAVSHDLRTPLAAAKAAVSCLRAGDIQLTAEDHDELLATADESLDLLTRLLASLLDVSRLQAGALPVFPRPADLKEIIARSLDGIGPGSRVVMVAVSPGLPQVLVDPPIMERVIANVTANALRYSPSGSPPRLTATARGGWVELRVADCGPGVPEADRERMFVPFQRLADTGSTSGVGLGLTVSRGLTEAMRGTLEPEETPGGGLTVAISVPAIPGQA
jgi:K+-sensing histidine kinase KdpD